MDREIELVRRLDPAPARPPDSDTELRREALQVSLKRFTGSSENDPPDLTVAQANVSVLTRRPWTYVAVVAVIALVAGTIGIAIQVRSSGHAGSLSGREVSELSRLGTLIASVDGDPKPDAAAVAASCGRASSYFANRPAHPAQGSPCYLVQLTGHFENEEPSRLLGTTAASGDTVSLVVTANAQLVAYRVSDRPIQLSKLGSTERLPIVDYRPSSSTAEQLDQIAVNTGAWAGDPNISSVTWVASTWGDASSKLQESTPGSSGSRTPSMSWRSPAASLSTCLFPPMLVRHRPARPWSSWCSRMTSRTPAEAVKDQSTSAFSAPLRRTARSESRRRGRRGSPFRLDGTALVEPPIIHPTEPRTDSAQRPTMPSTKLPPAMTAAGHRHRDNRP